jgi:hypothetical protein
MKVLNSNKHTIVTIVNINDYKLKKQIFIQNYYLIIIEEVS